MFSTAEGTCLTDNKVSDVAKPTSAATDYEHLAEGAEVVAVAAVQNDNLDDKNASMEEGGKAHTAASVTYGLIEGSADGRELDHEEESEVEQLSEMPGTPASLPSLVSEPEDTCMPVKFLQVSPATCTCTLH